MLSALVLAILNEQSTNHTTIFSSLQVSIIKKTCTFKIKFPQTLVNYQQKCLLSSLVLGDCRASQSAVRGRSSVRLLERGFMTFHVLFIFTRHTDHSDFIWKSWIFVSFKTFFMERTKFGKYIYFIMITWNSVQRAPCGDTAPSPDIVEFKNITLLFTEIYTEIN